MSIVMSEPDYGYPTTRRYPRTLSSAFPSAADCVAITHYSRPMRGLLRWAAWLALCLVIGAIIYGGM